MQPTSMTSFRNKSNLKADTYYKENSDFYCYFVDVCMCFTVLKLTLQILRLFLQQSRPLV